MQVQAGDTVIFNYYGMGRTDKRGGQAVGKDDGKGVFVTTNPKGNPPAGMYVRLTDVVEVRPMAEEERRAAIKEALSGLLKYEGDTVRTINNSKPSYFKRSSGVRR